MKNSILANIMAAVLIIAAFTLPCMADSNLTLSESSPPLRAGNYRIDQNDGVQNVPLMTFRAKSEGGDTRITAVNILIDGLSAKPTTLRLYEGDILFGTATVTGNVNQVLIHIDENIPSNNARIFTVKGDFPSTTSGWGHIFLLGVQTVSAGGVADDISPAFDIVGPTQHFFPNVAIFALAAQPTISKNEDQSGWTTKMAASFTFNVSAIGANLLQPKNADFTIVARTNPFDEIECSDVVAVTIPNTGIADGSTATVTVTVNLPAYQVAKSGQYSFAVKQINWGSTESGKIQQNWGLEDAKTSFLGFSKFGSVPWIPYRLTTVGASLYDSISQWIKGGEYGGAGQAVGEGQSIVIVPQETNPIHRVVFPYSNPNHGQAMQVDVTMNAADMNPFITAPGNLSGDPIGLVNYPVTNVLKTASASDNVVIKVQFDVTLGDFIAHGVITRTGIGSCRVKFYWGPGSSYDTPGTEIDLLNLSPGEPIPAKGYPGGKPRFKFEQKELSLSQIPGGQLVTMPVVAIPFSFTVQGSSDLLTWKNISWGYGYDTSTAADDGSMNGFISFDTASLAYFNIDPNRAFFRVKLTQ